MARRQRDHAPLGSIQPFAGLDVEGLEEEWGCGLKPDRIESALRADLSHKIKASVLVHNETALGICCYT
jgi:aspartate aminotransferase-like enzyme